MYAKRRAELRAVLESPNDLIGDHLQYAELESLLAADEREEMFDRDRDAWNALHNRLRAELATANEALTWTERELAATGNERGTYSLALSVARADIANLLQSIEIKDAALAVLRKERDEAPIGIVEGCHAGNMQLTTRAVFPQDMSIRLLRIPDEPRAPSPADDGEGM